MRSTRLIEADNDPLQEYATPDPNPYFDTTRASNVTGLVGKTIQLVCKVKNLGNRTVSNIRSFIGEKRFILKMGWSVVANKKLDDVTREKIVIYLMRVSFVYFVNLFSLLKRFQSALSRFTSSLVFSIFVQNKICRIMRQFINYLSFSLLFFMEILSNLYFSMQWKYFNLVRAKTNFEEPIEISIERDRDEFENSTRIRRWVNEMSNITRAGSTDLPTRVTRARIPRVVLRKSAKTSTFRLYIDESYARIDRPIAKPPWNVPLLFTILFRDILYVRIISFSFFSTIVTSDRRIWTTSALVALSKRAFFCFQEEPRRALQEFPM